MPCFGQREAWLRALYCEAVHEQSGVLVAPFIRRLGVDLAVEAAQFAKVPGRLIAVEHSEGDRPLRYHWSPALAGAALRRNSRSCSWKRATSATSGCLTVNARSNCRNQSTSRDERVSAASCRAFMPTAADSAGSRCPSRTLANLISSQTRLRT